MNRGDLIAALANSNVKAFLRVIRQGESSQDDNAYTELYGGGHFTDFTDHPRRHVTSGSTTSTAAGAYQALVGTWDDFVAATGPSDFSPASQDLFAVWCINRRHALSDVMAGNFQAAVAGCCREWASLPGSPYGQPTRTMAQALATYVQYGGALSATPVPVAPVPKLATPAPSPPTTGGHMPFLIPLLSAIMQAIPALAAKWGGDASVVATRNVAIAQTVAQGVMSAVGAVNEQDAIQKLQSDPAAVQQATQAVQDLWFQIDLTGVGAARDADAKFVQAGGRVWQSPSFWFTCMITPLVYLIVGGVLGLYGNLKLSEAVTGNLLTALISLIAGGAAGYYYGAMTSANKAPPAQ